MDLQQNNHSGIFMLEKLKINQTCGLTKKIKISLNKFYWGSASKVSLSFFVFGLGVTFWLELYCFWKVANKSTRLYEIMEIRAPLAAWCGTVPHGLIWRRTAQRPNCTRDWEHTQFSLVSIEIPYTDLGSKSCCILTVKIGGKEKHSRFFRSLCFVRMIDIIMHKVLNI